MISLRFAYPFVFYYLVPGMLALFVYRLLWYISPRYTYSLTNSLASTGLATKDYASRVLPILRGVLLVGLMFLIARPQWVDSNSLVHGFGRDIVITIDVSGSMRMFDDPNDMQTRIDVAKKEAISFIEKRPDDPIAVVAFAYDALSMSPLTLDKSMLKSTVGQLQLGVINPEGTSLGTGLATAVNRLRKSTSKTKIIILLTDGEPTPETDRVTPESALKMAQEFGIRIYTIGIGSRQGGIVRHPFGGYQRMPTSVDETLLKTLATETGGKYFRADSPSDMRQIYTTIDALEKTEYTTNVYQRFYEAFFYFLWFLLALFATELFLKLFVWRGL